MELYPDNNKLKADCDCESEENFCKHAIATLYSYADFCINKEQENLGGAVDEAIKERVKKGRNEVIRQTSFKTVVFIEKFAQLFCQISIDLRRFM